LLRAAQVPASPINDIGVVATHEQTLALGLLQSLAAVQVVAPPLSLDGERLLHASPPPQVGADTATILSDLRYGDDEIARLSEAGVLGGNAPAR
jgi:crotonobetainyl-CoA:carnitine CoA-transferase CaiB-like acyl-CoA transferase